MSDIPPEKPPNGVRIEMHGASYDSSMFIQIGTAIIQPLPPSPLDIRYSLPPDTAAFTGREKEIDIIAAAVSEAELSGGVVAIHSIGGMPGVGKTALAVHVAHLMRNRFPDRQLYINLRSHTPGQDPVPPEAALAELLIAVGVDARYLPGDIDGRVDLWRDRMSNQQILLVLDNAASTSQVAPLLPGNERCLVLITSRRHLGDLPGVVFPVLLDALPPEKAREMFLRLAPRTATAPEAAVRELLQLTGHLPLAISLIARVYSRHPTWNIADLIRETSASMLTLAAEKDNLAAVFDVSYRYLAPKHQQFFHRLGMSPGNTIDTYATAALANIDLAEAHDCLSVLYREGLLTEVGYQRYGMHDLIRLYSRKRASTDPAADVERGSQRLLDYYQHTATLADNLLARRSGSNSIISPQAVPNLSDRIQALSWVRTERANLLACLDHAGRTGQHARVVALTAGIATLLRQDGPWAEAVRRHSTAVKAAHDSGDQLGEASTLNNLGVAQRLTGDYSAATETLQTALNICREIGDQPGEASALYNLGVIQRLTGDYSAATETLQTALNICRDIGDQLGEASILNNLGVIQQLTGDYSAATETLQTALNICRDIGDQLGEASILNNLGDMQRQTGDYSAAAQAHEAALNISRNIGDRLGEAIALNYVGVMRRQTGDYTGATEALETALSICRELGDRGGEVVALNYLGVMRRQTGDYTGATKALQAALSIIRELGDRGGEAEVLNEVGTLYRLLGDLDQAETFHTQALEIACEIDTAWDEAHARAGLARCALAIGRTSDAKIGLQRALEIFERIGAADAVGIAAELASLTGAEPSPS